MSAELDTIVSAIRAQPTLDDALTTLLTEARRLTRAEAGTIYVREDFSLKFSVVQNDALAARVGDVETTQRLTLTPLPMSLGSIAGYVALTRTAVSLPDVYAISAERPFSFNREIDQENNYRTRSMLTLPLRDRKNIVFAVVQLINARSADGAVIPFTAEVQERVASLLAMAAPIFEAPSRQTSDDV
jgi:GAF domain-containing protein